MVNSVIYNKMNLIPRPVEGSILDLPIDPRVRLSWVTNTRYGPPIKRRAAQQREDEKPRDLGEERHHELISAIKGLKVKQNVSQTANVTEALLQNRDWRR